MSKLTIARDPNSKPEMLLVAAFSRFDEVLSNPSLSLIELEDAVMHKRIVCAARISKMMKLTSAWSTQHNESARRVIRAIWEGGWYKSSAETWEKQMLEDRPCWLVMRDAFNHIGDVAGAEIEELVALELTISAVSRVIKDAPPVEVPKADWDW